MGEWPSSPYLLPHGAHFGYLKASKLIPQLQSLTKPTHLPTAARAISSEQIPDQDKTLSATLSPASIERVAQPRCGDPGSHGPKNNAIYLGSFSKELVLVMQMIIIATLDDLYIMW